jgi:hypothetical protein
VPHKVGFAHTGRTGNDHVLLGIFDRRRLAAPGALTQKFRVVVMVADRDGEDLFGFVLLDNKTVEMRFDFARGKIEIENVFVRTGRLLRRAGRFGGRRAALLFFEAGGVG